MAPRSDGSVPVGRTAPSGPPVDIVREGDHLVVIISLPGTKPADSRLSLVGDRQLYIEGNFPYRHPVPREAMTLCERLYGPFSRTVTLPLPVQTVGADLRFENGILTARLPIRMQRLPLVWQ